MGTKETLLASVYPLHKVATVGPQHQRVTAEEATRQPQGRERNLRKC